MAIRALLLASTVAFTLGCTEPGLEQLEARGPVDPGDYPVLWLELVNPPPGYSGHGCSAVLVSERVVLTAGHCLLYNKTDDWSVQQGRGRPEDLKLYVGSHAATARPYGRVEQVFSTYGDDGQRMPGPEDDVGALVLAAPADPSELYLHPMPTTQGPTVGDTIEVVGFGDAADGSDPRDSAGIKRRSITASIEEVTDSVFRSQTRGCQGDSGGAVLRDGALLGINTRNGIGAGSCNDSWQTTYTRIDVCHGDCASDPLALARAAAGDTLGVPHDNAAVCGAADPGDRPSGDLPPAAPGYAATDDGTIAHVDATLDRPEDVDYYLVSLTDTPTGLFRPYARLRSDAIRRVQFTNYKTGGTDHVADVQFEVCIAFRTLANPGADVGTCPSSGYVDSDGMCCVAPLDGGDAFVELDGAGQPFRNDDGQMLVRIRSLWAAPVDDPARTDDAWEGATNRCASYGVDLGA